MNSLIRHPIFRTQTSAALSVSCPILYDIIRLYIILCFLLHFSSFPATGCVIMVIFSCCAVLIDTEIYVVLALLCIITMN